MLALIRFFAAAACLGSLACSPDASPLNPDPDPDPDPIPSDAPVLSRETFVGSLSNPWDLAFAPDGALFFTEKCEGLSVRRTNGTITRLAGTAGSSLVLADLVCEGQSGMHGVALHPDFATNRTLFVFMASDLSTNPRTNRVIRLELNADYGVASARVDIVTDIAFKHVSNAVGGAGSHSGGRLRFGPDGFLYITTGDNHSATIPQSPTVLGGKVLRVTATGAAAPGNNPPAGFDPRIYTYGHRNVQGITFHPTTGQPFISEHGPNHSDEVTPLVAGGNGGWDPQARPALTCPDDYCGYAGDPNTMPMTDLTRFPAALRPSWTNDNSSHGIGPSLFLTGTQWRAWNGRLLVGVMGRQRLALLTIAADGSAIDVDDVPLQAARYRSLVLGPDGSLYIATDGGQIWRVTPSTSPAP